MAERVNDRNDPPQPDGPHDTPPVVGIGASAGGIGALREFFSHVELPSGAAYVVILHLSPDHDSQLAEVLQSAAAMPVAQVTASVAIEADHVYVMSPNKSLTISDGQLSVADFTRAEAAPRAGRRVLPRAGRQPRITRGRRRAVRHRPQRVGGREADQGVRRPGDRPGSGRGRVRRHAAQLDRHRAGRLRAAGRRRCLRRSRPTSSTSAATIPDAEPARRGQR